MNVESFYKKLLKLYPKKFRHCFGDEMFLVWRDLYKNREELYGSSTMFWTSTIHDLMVNIVKQHIMEGRMQLFQRQVSKLPVEVLFLIVGSTTASLLILPLFLHISSLSSISPNATLVALLVTSMVAGLIFIMCLNFRLLTGNDDLAKRRARQGVVIFSACSCILFGSLFLTYWLPHEVGALTIAIGYIFLTRPWWGEQWLTGVSLILIGILFTGAVSLYATTNHNKLFTTDNLITRSELALCDGLLKKGPSEFCTITVETENGKTQKTY